MKTDMETIEEMLDALCHSHYNTGYYSEYDNKEIHSRLDSEQVEIREMLLELIQVSIDKNFSKGSLESARIIYKAMYE
jgi:hypothetical protein